MPVDLVDRCDLVRVFDARVLVKARFIYEKQRGFVLGTYQGSKFFLLSFFLSFFLSFDEEKQTKREENKTLLSHIKKCSYWWCEREPPRR